MGVEGSAGPGAEHRVWGGGDGEDEFDPSLWAPTHPHPTYGMLRLSCTGGGWGGHLRVHHLVVSG